MPVSSELGRSPRRLFVLTIVFVLTTLGTALYGQMPRVVLVRNPTTGRMVEAASDRIVIVPRVGVSAEAVRDACHRLNVISARSIFNGAVWEVRLQREQTVEEMLDRFRGTGLVRFAEPNILCKPLEVPRVIPNDPLWTELWGLQKIKCDVAWDFERGDPAVVVGVVDTGVDRTHPDLAENMWTNPGEVPNDGIDNDNNGYIDDVNGWDFHDNDNDPSPNDSGGLPSDHGTHVSGTIAAVTNNATGVAGVCWEASILPARAMGAAGGFGVMQAIEYVVENGADVINLSVGGGYSAAYQVVIDKAFEAGCVVVAAIGNDGEEFTTDPSTWMSPVCNDGVLGVDNKVLGVAATDENDVKADFSNYSGVYSFCDVSAPGVNILSTVWPGGGYDYKLGTSMACPHAAGLAALIRAQYTDLAPDKVIELIRTTADNIDSLNPLYAGKLGTGRINAMQAVKIDLPPLPATAVNAFDTANDEGGSITITWRRSGDDGAGWNDVIGYELWRGTQPDPTSPTFVRIAGTNELPAGKSGYIDNDPNLVNGQNYYYFVRTRDQANSTDSALSPPASPRDDLAPAVVDNLVARDTQADNGRSITLSWVGYQAAPDVQKFRVYRSLTEFTSTKDAQVLMVAEIPGSTARNYVDKAKNPDADPTDPDAHPLDQTDYWYAVTAVDEVDNEITTLTPTGPVRCAPNLSITFSYGLRMITVPAEPIDPSPSSVFGFTDPATASFARYDPLTRSYHTISQLPDDPFLRIVPGRAFWVNLPVPTFIGVGGRLVDDAETEVPLEQGWNQIGCPYDIDYPFEGITVRDQFGTETGITASNVVRKYGWRYDAFQRSYRLVSATLPGADKVLPKREGMWVYANQPGLKLVFGRDVVVPAQAARVAKTDGWQFQILARTATGADTDNFVGVSQQADVIGPILDPPGSGHGVDVFFTGSGAERLAADLRKNVEAGAKWQMVVECADASADVELLWPDLSAVPGHLRPVLKDLSTGRSVYMRTAGGYSFRLRERGEQRRFEISLAPANVGPVIAQVAATPIAGGGVELSYMLHRPAAVNIEVRNLAGRLVAIVPGKSGQVGINRVAWNGLGSNGRGVPSGRYLVCVTAVADDNGETARAVTSVVVTR